MQEFPHFYKVNAVAEVEGALRLQSEGLEDLLSAAPKEFGGPGDKWSPETLLVAAVADCFILSFRAIARASRLEWLAISCEVEGVLERQDGITRFTRFTVQPTLSLPPQTSDELAEKILLKAKKSCLITNSLSAETELRSKLIRGA